MAPDLRPETPAPVVVTIPLPASRSPHLPDALRMARAANRFEARMEADGRTLHVAAFRVTAGSLARAAALWALVKTWRASRLMVGHPPSLPNGGRLGGGLLACRAWARTPRAAQPALPRRSGPTTARRA